MPGMGISLNAMVSGTSQLPRSQPLKNRKDYRLKYRGYGEKRYIVGTA